MIEVQISSAVAVRPHYLKSKIPINGVQKQKVARETWKDEENVKWTDKEMDFCMSNGGYFMSVCY